MAANEGSFFTELKRRNVYRVGLAYIIASWLLLQVIDVVEPIIGTPEWVAKLILVLLAVGLPLVLVFSWAYEMTPEGLRREKDVDRSQSITGETGRRLDRLIVGILIVAVSLMAVDRYVFHDHDEAPPEIAGGPAGPNAVGAEAPPAESDTPSIAVLPFANMSADESSTYFSDGLADTLLHMLAQIREIRVAARTSSFQFRDQNTDITKIAEALNVGTVLEGSVQKAGNRIRVTAQLIEADTGYHLWSGNYDRDLDDVFAIQDEIANEVVDALRVSLLGDSAEQLATHETDNVDAYTEYLLAINASNEFTFQSLRTAEQRFLNAVSLDPNYALAWARLSHLYYVMSYMGVDDTNALHERALEAASRALDLDHRSATAIAVLAAIEQETGDLNNAEALFRKALDLAPNDPLVKQNYSELLVQKNERHEAIRVLAEALVLDPLSTQLHDQLFWQYFVLDDYDRAAEYIDKLKTIKPESPLPWYREAEFEFTRGNWAAAVLASMSAHELDPDDPEIATLTGDYLLALEMPDEARKWYDRAAEIDANHPVSKAAPLTLYLYEQATTPDGPALARQLITERIDARQGSRSIVLQTLWQQGVRAGNLDETLEFLSGYFPEYFEEGGDWSRWEDGTTWHIGAMLHSAGREDHAWRLLQPLVEQTAEGVDKYGLSMFHIWNLAATGQREPLLAALREYRAMGRARDSWPISVRHFPAFDFVRDEPEFVAYVEWLEQHAGEQREELRRLRGADTKKRGPI